MQDEQGCYSCQCKPGILSYIPYHYCWGTTNSIATAINLASSSAKRSWLSCALCKKCCVNCLIWLVFYSKIMLRNYLVCESYDSNVTIDVMATLQKQFLIHFVCCVDFFLDDCTIDCPLGRVIDEKGRELCECAEPERPKCPSMIRCQKNCVYGYKVILTVPNNIMNYSFMKEKTALPVVYYLI